MSRIRGAIAGLIVAALLTPIIWMMEFFVIFALGVLSLANVPLAKQLYAGLPIGGHPFLVTAVFTTACFVSVGATYRWRIFSWGCPPAA